MKCVKGA
jgi:hypothetical protein